MITSSVLPCVECFHFKAINVTRYNIETFFFKENKPLNKQLFDKAEIRVYFCKMQKTPRAIYINKQDAYALTNTTCDCGDYEDT